MSEMAGLSKLQESLLAEAAKYKHLVVFLPPPQLSIPISSHIHSDASLERACDEQRRLDAEYLNPVADLVDKGLLRLVDREDRTLRYETTGAPTT